MIVRSTFFKLVIGGILVFGVFVFTLNFISYRHDRNSFEFIDDSNAYLNSNNNDDELMRITADFKSNSKPSLLYANNNGKVDIPNVRIRTYMIATNNEQDQNVLIRGAGEGNFNILLLHDQAYSSKIWEKIGTLQYLASWGYHAFAIDLPGYGNSSLPVIQEKAAGIWLTKLISLLRLSNFVIISPSMSARFSLPYVIQPNVKQKSLRGFISIAPIDTKKFDPHDYKQIQIPTLIVRGKNDKESQVNIDILEQIPNKELLIITNASNACYIQQPVAFHNGLRQFLYKVYHPIYEEQYAKQSESLIYSSSLPSSSLTFDMNQTSKRKKVSKFIKSKEKQQYTL